MIVIRKAKKEDTQSIFDIRKKAILHQCIGHYSDEQLAIWTDGSPTEAFMAMVDEGFHVAVEGEKIIATGMISTRDGMIDGIFVEPDFMGKGVGKLILKHLEDIAIAVGLGEMKLDSTLNAAGFYRSFGFQGDKVSTYQSPRGISLSCVPMKKKLENI